LKLTTTRKTHTLSSRWRTTSSIKLRKRKTKVKMKKQRNRPIQVIRSHQNKTKFKIKLLIPKMKVLRRLHLMPKAKPIPRI
jgi:hypothetical protein